MQIMGMLRAVSLREQFLKGEYGELVQLHDKSRAAVRARDLPWVAASLASMGRIDEALALEKVIRPLGKEPIARFYIIVALIRSSEYELAHAELSSFLSESRSSASETARGSRFYVFQALGFRAFFEGHYKKSLFWANRAWALAIRSGGLHERILSSDLRGHCLVQMGEVETGLESLESALEIAKRFGNKSHMQALRAALAIAEAQHGYRSKEELRDLLADSLLGDSYTSANVFIELVRQENLMGRYRQALKIVAETRPLIKRIRHKRQMASLAVREAYSHFRLGDSKRALEILAAAEKRLESRDRAILVEVKGLQYQVQMAASPRRTKALLQLFAEVKKLAHEVRNHRSLSYLKRWESSSVAPPARTPIDRWIHGVTDYHVRRELLDRGYLDFFSSQFGRSESDAILLSLVAGKVLYRVRAELFVGEDKFSNNLRRGLFILARARCTKEELLQLVWGYQYEASRHDTLLYTFIRRLRVALGPLKSALGYSSTDGTYGFLRPVVVQVMEFEGHEGFNAEELAGGEKQISPQNVSKKLIEGLKSWNPRQLEVMAKLRAANRESRSLTGRIVRPKQLIETYGVSRITAGRDLAELAEKGLLIRIGSGRGTGYMLNT